MAPVRKKRGTVSKKKAVKKIKTIEEEEDLVVYDLREIRGKLAELDHSEYFERFLMKNFDPKKTDYTQIMSMIYMLNKRFRSLGNMSWNWTSQFTAKKIGSFYEEVINRAEEKQTDEERSEYVYFFIQSLNCLDHDTIQQKVSDNILELSKGFSSKFFECLNQEEMKPIEFTFVTYFMDLTIDMLTHLGIRLEVRQHLQQTRFIHKIVRSKWFTTSKQSKDVFSKLLDDIRFFVFMELIDSERSTPIPEKEEHLNYNVKLNTFLKDCYNKYPKKLKELCFASCKTLSEDKKFVKNQLNGLSVPELRNLFPFLESSDPPPASKSEKSMEEEEDSEDEVEDTEEEVLLREEYYQLFFDEFLARPSNKIEEINSTTLLFSEAEIFSKILHTSSNYNAVGVLPYPKLNLHFLSFFDYFLRNFQLMYHETCYELANDVGDAIHRSCPRMEEDSGVTTFVGRSPYACPVERFQVLDVADPKIGDLKPKYVHAELCIDLTFVYANSRTAWEELRPTDVLFLCTVDATLPQQEREENAGRYDLTPQQLGLQNVRGCEILEVIEDEVKKEENINQYLDKDERINEVVKKIAKANTISRKYKVRLDEAQYYKDITGESGEAGYNVYDSFNLVVRRNSKANTFQSLLSTVRSLIKSESKFISRTSVPKWIYLPFLGIERYDPKFWAKENRKQKGLYPKLQTVKKNECFLDPLTQDVPFTPQQFNSIKKGLNRGVSLIVGPPGTGKTDVAVQIIDLLFHKYPNQKTLIITHSNAALNDIFEKIHNRDIPEGYLLRLGHGSSSLKSTVEEGTDFTRRGRVNYLLGRRDMLLQKIEIIAKALEFATHVWLSIDTALSFYTYALVPLIKDLKDSESSEKIPDFTKKDITDIVEELKEIQPFEVLRRQNRRAEYLLCYHSKIVAMTCVHASMNRDYFVDLDFSFDNIIMEESAQIPEIEACVPLFLQKPTSNESRLQRIILLGDHYQLPPIVQHQGLARYSNFSQSLFQRFVRLGFPQTMLKHQGRCRPSLSKLFAWRYDGLQDLPIVDPESKSCSQEFTVHNAGMLKTSQFINVEDYLGKGESTPKPFFYQNVGEAEYVVHVALFLINQGHDPHSITVLTTYNGQRDLLWRLYRDRSYKFYQATGISGKGVIISTVDNYQGQQNDIVLLSLVRTKAYGHIRDPRRLVVAMSRARLGLYVFGRLSLFSKCLEMEPALKLLDDGKNVLSIVPKETFPSQRLVSEPDSPELERMEFPDGFVTFSRFLWNHFTRKTNFQ